MDEETRDKMCKINEKVKKYREKIEKLKPKEIEELVAIKEELEDMREQLYTKVDEIEIITIHALITEIENLLEELSFRNRTQKRRVAIR